MLVELSSRKAVGDQYGLLAVDVIEGVFGAAFNYAAPWSAGSVRTRPFGAGADVAAYYKDTPERTAVELAEVGAEALAKLVPVHVTFRPDWMQDAVVAVEARCTVLQRAAGEAAEQFCRRALGLNGGARPSP